MWWLHSCILHKSLFTPAANSRHPREPTEPTAPHVARAKHELKGVFSNVSVTTRASVRDGEVNDARFCPISEVWSPAERPRSAGRRWRRPTAEKLTSSISRASLAGRLSRSVGDRGTGRDARGRVQWCKGWRAVPGQGSHAQHRQMTVHDTWPPTPVIGRATM